MVKTIVAGCMVLLATLVLWACNDKIDVQQAYPFQLTSWYIPEEITEEENVEIRLTMTRHRRWWLEANPKCYCLTSLAGLEITELIYISAFKGITY